MISARASLGTRCLLTHAALLAASASSVTLRVVGLVQLVTKPQPHLEVKD